MRIAILGYYEAQNAGDDRIQHAMRKGLTSDQLTFYRAWGDLKAKKREIEQHDFLIIGGGGLIIRNTNSLASLIQHIQIPFAVIGISVSSNAEDNQECIRALAQNACYINVRDKKSFEIFNLYSPKCEVQQSYDLTFACPFNSKVETLRSGKIGISLRDWHDFRSEQYSREFQRKQWLKHQLKKLNISFPFIKHWNIARFNEFVTSLPGEKLGFLMDKTQDIAALKQIDLKSIEPFDAKTFAQYDIVIAMRLHACIFATQMGIPFIALNYMEKVRNFCEEIGHGEFCVDLNKISDIEQILARLQTKKQEVTENLLHHREQGQRSTLDVFTELKQVINIQVSP